MKKKKNKKGNVVSSGEIKNFIKLFERLCHRHDAFTVYSDFVAVCAISIGNTVNFNQDRENQYLNIMKKYSEEEGDVFSQMLAEIIKVMQKDAEGKTPCYRDYLGELFQELNLGNSWKGQFFTPQCVSNMMGKIELESFEKTIGEKGYVSLLEPCVGGGSTIIGIINAMFAKGLNPCKQLLVTAYDIDERCVHMSYIQFSLMGIPAIVQQKDSLANKVFGSQFFTPAYILDRWWEKAEKLEIIAQDTQNEKPVQLTLF